MAYSDILISHKNLLIDLNSSVNVVSNNLKKAFDNLDRADKNIANCFTINSSRADMNEINLCLVELQNIINKTNSCSVMISNSVNSLTTNIDKQIELEKMESENNE